MEVFKVLMVCDYFKGEFVSLQPMSSLLKCQLDCQELMVAVVVITLHWGQFLGIEVTWMEMRRLILPLRYYSSYPGGGCINLHYKREFRIGMCKGRSCAEGFFECLEEG